jgi:3',5'-cyclic AMP phosphodiesterase CpdA
VYSNVKQAKAKSTGEGEYDLRFGIISDVHVGAGIYPPTHQRLEQVLDWYNTEDVNILAIVGDITDSGTQVEWDTFKNSWENHKDKLQLIAVMGNHEIFGELFYGETKDVCADRFETATGQKTNAHYVIDGYHFIVLSAGSGAFIEQGDVGGAIATGRNEIPGSLVGGGNFSLSVKEWARERINIAKADVPGKPIFVFLHWPLRNTIPRSDTNYTSSFGNDPLMGFFKDDPEVVIFSGHIHTPNNDPRSIWQGGFTAVNTVTLNYLAMDNGFLGKSTDGIKNSPYPKIAGLPPGAGTGQGLIVSVKGSKVIIENFDFDVIEGLRPLGDVVKIPQTWEFDVSRPMDFPYTNAIRETQKTAPVFGGTKSRDAIPNRVIIKKVEDTTVEVEFPQAKIPGPNYGNEIVYSYRFEFINRQTGVIDRTAKQWSDFMLTPRLQKPTYTQLIGGLKPGTEYELRIYAYGSFQECSSQYLFCTFTTSDTISDVE